MSTYSIRPYLDTSYAFTLASTGRDVTLEKRDSKNNRQLWIEEDNSGGYFMLENAARHDLCLAIPKGNPNREVFAYQCDSDFRDQWWAWSDGRLLNSATKNAAAPKSLSSGAQIIQVHQASAQAVLVRSN
ncbi:RICIN domain-containing protein [Actinosynnema sp. NPDC049800]